MQNILKQQKSTLPLTFNPGLASTRFWTTCRRELSFLPNKSHILTCNSIKIKLQWAISKFPCASVSKRVLMRNFTHENEFNLHENKSAWEKNISIWMVSHEDSFWLQHWTYQVWWSTGEAWEICHPNKLPIPNGQEAHVICHLYLTDILWVAINLARNSLKIHGTKIRKQYSIPLDQAECIPPNLSQPNQWICVG